MAEGQRDPRAWLPTRDRLDLRHPRPREVETVDCTAASARSAISQDEITGWYAESPGSNSRSAYAYASA